jgi:hypothetical protein
MYNKKNIIIYKCISFIFRNLLNKKVHLNWVLVRTIAYLFLIPIKNLLCLGYEDLFVKQSGSFKICIKKTACGYLNDLDT